jgi:hypothetical protein
MGKTGKGVLFYSALAPQVRLFVKSYLNLKMRKIKNAALVRFGAKAFVRYHSSRRRRLSCTETTTNPPCWEFCEQHTRVARNYGGKRTNTSFQDQFRWQFLPLCSFSQASATTKTTRGTRPVRLDLTVIIGKSPPTENCFDKRFFSWFLHRHHIFFILFF